MVTRTKKTAVTSKPVTSEKKATTVAKPAVVVAAPIKATVAIATPKKRPANLPWKPSAVEIMAIGRKFKQLRVKRNLSQLEVAEKALGYSGSHAAVSRLERGVLKSVAESTVKSLAKFFKVSMTTLRADIEVA